MKQETILLDNNISFTGYENEYVFEKIKSGTFYENDLLLRWTDSINENSIVFDIGANLGNHTLFFSKIKNAKKVYSFEPVKKNYELLERNCKDNSCTQVELFNFGLGAQNGFANMTDNVHNFGAIELNESYDGVIKIYTIDELNLPGPDFVKIDVEGFEIKVLKGMHRTLTQYCPDLWIEVRPDTFHDVNSLLMIYGYKIIDFDDKFNLYYSTSEEKKEINLEKVLNSFYSNVQYAEKEMWAAKKYESQFLYEQNKVLELKKSLEKKESQFQYEQKKANELLESLKKKESQFQYEQKKANELLDSLKQKESQYLSEQNKVKDISIELSNLQEKLQEAEKDILSKNLYIEDLHHENNVAKEAITELEDALNQEKNNSETYKNSSMKYCSQFLYEQKKCESLSTELTLYKSSKLYKVQKKIWTIKSKMRFYTKKHVYKLAYKVYRVIEPYPSLVRLAYKVNDKLKIVNNKDEARQIYHESKDGTVAWKNSVLSAKKIKDLKIAAILDEFSYNCFKYECNLITFEPNNWLEIFENEKPDLFFCESAWSGIDSNKRPWKGKIYSSINFPKENREVLLSILQYCKEHNIPTIFWNKEDPSHYEDKVHDFVKTAVLFDHIFTTAEECVERYKNEYGHKSVHSLMFATQPKMFHPMEEFERTDEIIFAGSWYSYHEQRCKEMEEIFDKILSSGKNLVIYDRYYGDPDPNHIYPEKYAPYIRPALPFEEINKAYKGSDIALNITTVTESETMFARRVFELASCNTAIISNYSVGIERVFGDNVIFTDRDLDFSNLDKKREANLINVLSNHTYKNRLEQLLTDIGYDFVPENNSVAVIYTVKNKEELNRAVNNFRSIVYTNKSFKVLYDDSSLDISFLRYLEETGYEFYCKSYLTKYNKMISNDSSYVVYANNNLRNDFIEKSIIHFTYLSSTQVVLQTDDGYRIVSCDKLDNLETINYLMKLDV